jgi:Icc-related predicted phosphoesterase
MKIRIASDLHTEFHADRGETLLGEVTSGEYDVLVVAGDLSDAENLPRALGLLARGTEGRPIVYVLGNHEYYGATRAAIVRRVREIEETHSHLYLLDTEAVTIDGVRFLGTTLWFPKTPVPGPEWAMNDFTVIPGFRDWVYAENRVALKMLERGIAQADVIVTHHLPHQRSVSRQYVGSPLNPYFVCEVPALKAPERLGRKLWIHGHTHDSARYRLGELGEVEVICNPFGYAGEEENPDFDPLLTVFLEGASGGISGNAAVSSGKASRREGRER